jgi:hypothetical protein
MSAVDQFAAEAAVFEQWARCGTAQGEWATREALIRLTHLYLAALNLPPSWSAEVADQPEVERVGAEEYRAVAASCARFPLDLYSKVFDPLVVPPEEPVGATIADDIADIYRDVVTGQRAYQAGRRAQAVWEWGFNFRIHWGEHALGAIRALHCWLAANAFDRLAAAADLSAAADRPRD